MWQQYEMVTSAPLAEREARFDRAGQIKSARAETDRRFGMGPVRSAALLVAGLALVMVGRMVLA